MSIVTPRPGRVLRAVAAIALIPLITASAQAQALPAAKDLIARWAKETNAEAWKAHKSSRMKAAFDLPAMGMSAVMEVVTVYPSTTSSRIELPGVGEMRQGFNGTTAWTTNPMQGPSVMSGALLEAAKEDNNPSNYSRISPAIVSSETLEKTTLGGQECYKVKHTWKSGKNSFDCFGVSDGMVTWSQAKVASAMGEVETTTSYSGYKDWGGVKRATTTTVDQMGQQIVITVQAFEWDTVDPKEVELPAEIKALTEKK
ncbi:MAG: hypothetical protein ABIZ91_06540 [Gemmatimonadaceae bacterium]